MEIGIHELTAGYALDALDDEERRVFEEHLPDCAQCQEELASFWDVTGALALAGTASEPPAALRERILARARAESQTVVPLRTRRFQPAQVFGAAVAIAAVALIALGWWTVSLHNRLADSRSALAEQRAAASILGDRTARRISLTSGNGTLVDAADGAVLVVDGLSPAPAGRTYEVWVMRKGIAPASSGLFAGGRRSIVLVQHELATGDIVAVTLERAGGSAAPTTTPVAASHPV